MSVQLTQEQQAVVNDRGGELLVSAAAGSGKTRVLVERLLDRVELEGLNVDQFLIITFTKAAAAELRGKILKSLNQRIAQKPNDRHLQRQLTLIYRAQISTIHSFCGMLLREFGHQLDLDPDFITAEETDSDLLRREALERVIEEKYQDLEKDDPFSKLVDMMSAGRDDQRLKAIVMDIHRRIQSHPDPKAWLEQQSQAFDLSGCKDVIKTPWGQQIAVRAKRMVEYWYQRMLGAINEMMEDSELEKAYSPSFCDTMDSMEDFLGALERGWDSARALSEITFSRLGTSRKITMKELQERVKNIRTQCKQRMEKLSGLFYADNQTILDDMAEVRTAVQMLFRLVNELDERYASLKRRRHLVDFNDLEHMTLHLLRDAEGQPTATALLLRERYAEVMVDEYQDTNAVQNAIFDSLTQDGRNLFQVGDIKQSIYRFRLADPTIFLRKYAAFRHYTDAKPGQPRTIVLSKNFRSRASVLDGVNFIFENIMSKEFGEIDYTEDQRLNPGFPYTDHPNDRVEFDVVDLSPVEREEDQPKIPKDQVEAEFVAKRIQQLLQEGYPITDEDGSMRPVRPEEIAVLYRSPAAVMGYLTTALDQRDIPWQTEGAEDCFKSTEVRCAMAFLEVIDNPRQDIPLLAVLRSPVYGFTPDQLAHLRANCATGDLYTCLEESARRGEEPSLSFLKELEQLRLRSADTSCHRLLWSIYDETGLLAFFGAMHGGERRRENLLAFYDWVRAYGSRGKSSLFDFVTYIRKLRERGGRMLPLSRSGGSGVQIMSIHRSKGLEYPVVIVAGLNRVINRSDETAPVLFHPKLGVGPKGVDVKLGVEYPTLARQAVALKIEEETKAEELRLLYVAMTRAREKLIMTMSVNKAWKELSAMLQEAGPKPDAQALQEKNSVGKCMLLSILARTDANALRMGESALQPISASDWDINLIPGWAPGDRRGQVEETRVQNREEQLEKPDLSLLQWRYPWQELEKIPSKVTATQMKGRLLDLEAAEDTIPSNQAKEITFPRPDFIQQEKGLTSAQKGTVLHNVMEMIQLDKAYTVEGVRQELDRMIAGGWLTKIEADSVVPSQVAQFFASPLGQEARAASDLRREFKFSLFIAAKGLYPDVPEGEKIMLQGVADCVFSTPEGITIVDFKTDHVKKADLESYSQRYKEQIESYSWAMEQIFRRPVVRRVLWYFRTGSAYCM